MSKEFQVAAYEGGKLRLLASGSKGREVVLALPLSRLVLRVLRVPSDADPVETAAPVLQAMSPYPDDPLAVSCETVRESEDGKVVLAAGLPESAAEDVGEALDAAKLSVVRIDALALGQLRGLWPQLEGGGRRVVLIEGADCLTLFVLDGDQPSAVRAVSNGASLRREAMLSLLEAEDFGGARPIDEVVLVHVPLPAEEEVPPPDASADGEAEPAAETAAVALPSPSAALTLEAVRAEFAAFRPGTVRELSVGEDAGLVGVSERAAEPGALDALPDSWREVLGETRFKRKLVRNLSIACGLWALAMGVLFGVPMAYDFLTGRIAKRIASQKSAYDEVAAMRKKTGLVEGYSDRETSVLELMLAVSERMPAEVTVKTLEFERGAKIEDADRAGRELKVRLKGVSKGDNPTSPVFDLQKSLERLMTRPVASGEDEAEPKPFFSAVKQGPMPVKDGTCRFDIECENSQEMPQ